MRKKVFSKKVIYISRVVLAGFLVIALAIYAGNVLYGKNSYEVLTTLTRDKFKLQEAIAILKKDNAALQKEYFELRQLDPDTRRDK